MSETINTIRVEAYKKALDEANENIESLSLCEFVDELMEVCDKYCIKELFATYIGNFICDMRNAGLISNPMDDFDNEKVEVYNL